jgi:hypothetical protein
MYCDVARYAYLRYGALVPHIALGPTLVTGVITLGVMQQIVRAFAFLNPGSGIGPAERVKPSSAGASVEPDHQGSYMHLTVGQFTGVYTCAECGIPSLTTRSVGRAAPTQTGMGSRA